MNTRTQTTRPRAPGIVPSRRRPLFLGSSSRRAFTLVEMLAVIAVVGILLTVAILGFNAFGRSVRLRTAARVIQQHLAGARELAMTRQGVYGVWFLPNVGTPDQIYIYYRPSTGPVEKVRQPVDLPQGIEFGNSETIPGDLPPSNGLDFKPTGRAEAFGGGLLTFKIHDTDSGKEQEISVVPLTGHSQVKDN
ncbi:MAG: prepilin-type N-terminal cleavage/methylation domain-containing protein [Verrucomicrobia bacterium]|nr:prepilin-type N-terminal cleavage/methylation domain-containing protein [Verrucomicrobiota bacterium]